VRVVPQKAQAGAYHRGEEDRHLPRPFNVDYLEVGGQLDIAGAVGEYGEGEGGENYCARRQAVQAVGEVHRVGGAYYHQHHQRGVHQAEVKVHFFGVGDGKQRGITGIGRVDGQVAGHGDGGEKLQGEFKDGGRAPGVLLYQLGVVVQPAGEGQHHGGEQEQQYEAVIQAGPEQRGGDQREENKQAAHGGGALLYQVRLRAVGALYLAYLVGTEFCYQPGAYEQAQQEGGHYGAPGPEGNILENVQRAEDVAEMVCVVKHALLKNTAAQQTRGSDYILLFLKQYNYDNYKCKHEKNGDVNEIESFFTEISDCLIYEIYLKEDLKTKLFDSISDSNLPRVNYDEWLSLELKESLSNYEKKLKNDIEIKNLDVISKTYKKLESQEKIDNDIKIIRESELIKKIKKLIPPSQL